MRKSSTLVVLFLVALAGTARAEEATPATAAPAATTPTSPVGEATPSPARAEGATPAMAAPAVASSIPPGEDAITTTVSTQPTASRRKLELGLGFVPMAVGKFTSTPGGTPKTVDAAFAYGAVLSASYEVLHGLFVGLAPQLTFNVRDKTAADSDKARELDVLVRVAYAYRLVDTISVYAEVLPGYSLILPPNGSAPRGIVLAFGAGASMDLTDRCFANFGMGYQIGYQNRDESGVSLETRTKYVRVVMGGGVKF